VLATKILTVTITGGRLQTTTEKKRKATARLTPTLGRVDRVAQSYDCELQ